MKSALFLDRDGTINIDKIGGYVTKPSEIELIPGAGHALIEAKKLDLTLAVITNQAGIGKNLYTASDLKQIHRQLETLIEKETATEEFRFDHIEFCPHKSDE